jgi:hypothetical protein
LNPMMRTVFAWRKKGNKKRDSRWHEMAWNGDHPIIHFQWDLCVFCNLQKRNPVERKPTDNLLMCCIRRANLDSLWSRERSTVTSNSRNVRKGLDVSSHVDLRNPYKPFMSMPVANITGHRAAIQMLLCSLEPGKYSDNYKEFETIRKSRSAFLNVWGASPRGTCFNIFNGMEDKHKQRLTQCPTDSEWFAP